MIKKLTLILCLVLFATLASAGITQQYLGVLARINAVVPSGDTCAIDGLLTSWHMEDLNLANEDGCSVLGDSTWVAAGEATVTLSSTDKSDGSKSSYSAEDNNYHQLSPTQNMTWGSQGTMEMDLRITTYYADQKIFHIAADYSNHTYVRMVGGTGSVDFRGSYEGNTALASTAICYSNIDETANGWYRIKYQWDFTPTGSNYQSISVWLLDSASPREIDGEVLCTTYGTTALTTPVGTPTIMINNYGATDGFFYADNFKYYATEDL